MNDTLPRCSICRSVKVCGTCLGSLLIVATTIAIFVVAYAIAFAVPIR